jgi:alanine dehydrogenase
LIVGVPREVKDHETRVGLVPGGVVALHEAGHAVLVEAGAGTGSSIPDRDYAEAGAALVSAAEVWGRSDLVIKVKEPQPSEYAFFRSGLILFTYLHLAPLPERCTWKPRTEAGACCWAACRVCLRGTS